ncbi:E3 ubiquitin-protein ligase SINAT3-like [Vitis riparia]|uniref:E3 ubiquitin-protein ligase SINAT3-like n=1 Tax=Vitis riparia TaxID=96939 RepID=UPI00155A08AE|nr:E3 ubiquitin-protein ligase SINAT3-like [Vitis riparia]
MFETKLLFLQCHNGHTLCSSYKTRVLNKCPTCRQYLGDIRCLALEKMVESLELHCKNEEFGCPEIIPYHTKLMHEDSCNFQPYSCPWYGCLCSVVGDIPLLVSHLIDYHKAVMLYGCKFKLEFLIEDLYKYQSYKWDLTIINCFDKPFCLHAEAFLIGSTPIYMAFLNLIGNQAEIDNYSYSLEIGGNGRKLTFEGIPRSIRESKRSSLESANNLIMLGGMVFSLGGETRMPMLWVTGRIWKAQIPG